MVNGLGVLGWGVGGIEAEAGMLGQPTSMLIPPVVGLRLTGATREGVTATDVVLTITELLRDHGVVGKFVEAYGPGVASLSLETRATIGNMSPEYGATCTLFPIDQVTIDYLTFTGRDPRARRPGRGLRPGPGRLARRQPPPSPSTPSTSSSTWTPSSRAWPGPSAPRTASRSPGARRAFRHALGREPIEVRGVGRGRPPARRRGHGGRHHLVHQHLEPRGARRGGPGRARAPSSAVSAVKPWVKTSLAPGSRVVMDYLERADLVEPLDAARLLPGGLRLHDLHRQHRAAARGVSEAVTTSHDLSVVSVLSGNRNFEGRIHPDVKQNFLASPPLVVAYALAGTIDIDLTNEPLGTGTDGEPVFLSRPVAERRRGRRGGARLDHPRDVRRRATPRLQRRRALGGGARRPTPSPTPGTTARPTSSCPPTSRASPRSRAW